MPWPRRRVVRRSLALLNHVVGRRRALLGEPAHHGLQVDRLGHAQGRIEYQG